MFQHLDRLRRLAFKDLLRRNLRFLASFRIFTSTLRQIEPPIQERMPLRGGIGQEDADLTAQGSS
jgi:hypothetical protein